MKTIRTLFSGGELFGIGAQAAGYRHVDGYELRQDIALIACLNGFNMHVADVRSIDYDSLIPVDHLHASPSCKTASQANPQSGETPEDIEVADAICRAVRAHSGSTFSLENVWQYRNFESFKRILAALRESGFIVDWRHVNAADYGVPQTRKRLILRAVRGRRVPALHPTHRKHGDMFSAPWNGWYAAIEDLIPGLPDTQPAPWQAQRLGRLDETTLVGQGGFDGAIVTDRHDSPTFTITANHNQNQIRAYLLGGGNTNLTEPTSLPREAREPAFTVRDGRNGSPERAFLIAGQNQSNERVHPQSDEPAWVVDTSGHGTPRAFLVDGANGRTSESHPTCADRESPAFTIGANKCVHRAIVSGVWKRLTVQALGRFQTVPDSYIGLTGEINGNGVPCLLSQRIMESFV